MLQNTVEGFTGTQVLLLLRIQRCFQLIVEQELGNGQRALHFEAYLAFLGFVLFWTDRVHTCERDILPCLDAKRIKLRTILAQSHFLKNTVFLHLPDIEAHRLQLLFGHTYFVVDHFLELLRRGAVFATHSQGFIVLGIDL